MTAKNNDDPQQQVRVLGDIIVIHADGLRREQVRRLASDCYKAMRTIAVIDAYNIAVGRKEQMRD